MKVYLLTTGERGDDGNWFDIISIHATNDSALYAKEYYERARYRPDGSTYNHYAKIEEWEVKP